MRPSGGNLKRHVGTHDGGEQPGDEGNDATDRAAKADTILLIIDGEVGIESARRKNIPQADSNHENKSILLELRLGPGQTVADTHRHAAHDTSWIGRHASPGTRAGLEAVAGRRAVAWRTSWLSSVAGLRTITRSTPSLRVITGLGTVAWVTWRVRSIYSTSLPQIPDTTLKTSPRKHHCISWGRP